MKKILRPKIYLFLVALLLAQAGCIKIIKKTRSLPPEQRLLPAKSATRDELLKGLEEESKQVQTLKGGIALDLTTGSPKSGVLSEYRQTRGAIVVMRPDHMLIQVQAPLVLTTLATMVSDGSQYRVSIPMKNQYAVGNVNAPLTSDSTLNNLRPKIIMDGLFVDIRPYLNKQQYRLPLEEAVEGTHSFYIFGIIDVSKKEAQYVEKIWIDRTDMQVGRKQTFGSEGKLESDVRYQNYQAERGIVFPQIVVISRPADDYTIKMTFVTKALNESIPNDAFNLPRPEGSELVQLTK